MRTRQTATRAKKQKRRERRHKARSVPSDFRIVEADGGTDCALVLEAAEHDDDEKPKLHKFKMTAYNGGKLDIGGFFDPVVVDLSGLKVSAKSRPILRGHDPNRIVGHTETILITAGSIKVAGMVSAANEHSAEVVDSSLNGFPWQASIGVRGIKMSFVDDGESVKVNGRTFTGPLIVARQSVLREVSFVALGADDTTSAKIAASARSQIGVTDMDFEKWVEAAGWKVDDLSDSQRVTLQAACDAEGEAEAADDDGEARKTILRDLDGKIDAGEIDAPIEEHVNRIEARRKADAAEVERVDAVREICAKYESPKMKINGKDRTIEAIAIEGGWDLDKTELEAMREARPKAPAGHSHDHEDTHNLQAMQAGMLLRAGLALDHKSFETPQAIALGVPQFLRAGINDDNRQQAMEAAYRLSDMSMVDFCREACRIDGAHVPSNRTALIQAAFSGGALTAIFTTNVNTLILATYQETGDTTGGWTQERDVSDFKSNERPRMLKGPALARLPRNGTADNYDRSDVVESYKIARYARIFTIDEQDVIDDSFDALADTPREMGLAAARLRPDLVYSILLANAALVDAVALFHADHNNLQTSAALAAATLKTAIGQTELQTEGGVNLNLRTSHLVVPSELRHTAAELIRSSTIVIAGNTDAERGNVNTINSEENLTLVSDSRLSNGVTDPTDDTVRAGAADTWFTASNMGHTIEVGFLRGTGRAPSSRAFTLDQGQFGVGWDVKMDIGAKSLDFKGMNKNTA